MTIRKLIYTVILGIQIGLYIWGTWYFFTHMNFGLGSLFFVVILGFAHSILRALGNLFRWFK